MNRPEAIAAQNVFSLAHPEFYEQLSRHSLSSDYVDRLRGLLPDTWVLERSDVWVHARRPADSTAGSSPVAQGFKIHVSSAPMHALRVLGLIVPVCVRESVGFKIAGDPSMLHLLNSKLQGRGYSGKFMTIYPAGEEEFRDLIEELYQKTRGEAVEGPYILSDRRYKESKLLFYRFGGFHPPYRLNNDGTQTSCLVSPGGEYVPDQRLPYFQLPDWVRDPFPGTPGAEPKEKTLLDERYVVEGALGFSNSGGIYYGNDTATGQSIIIKEARPLTNSWSFGERTWDAVHLLEREYEVLRRLEGLSFVPAPVDMFQDWEHTFLVEERVDAIRLDAYWAQEDVILAPYIRREGAIERFLPKFKHVAERLISMVESIHGRGVLLGDLSPRNILINAETQRMWCIDFESAVMEEDDAELLTYATRWGTPGFLHPDRSSRTRLLAEDDFYSLGMSLYSCVVPVNNLFTLNPSAQRVFLKKFIALGVPREVEDIVFSLLRGAVDEAQEILTKWEI